MSIVLIPQPIMDYETIRKDEKKPTKKEVKENQIKIVDFIEYLFVGCK
jgi:hypothetical protein